MKTVKRQRCSNGFKTVCECEGAPMVISLDHCDDRHENGCFPENEAPHSKRHHIGDEDSHNYAVHDDRIAGIMAVPNCLQRTLHAGPFYQWFNAINLQSRQVWVTRRLPQPADGTGCVWAHRLSRVISLQI